ncbi:ribonuclease R [Lacticaseibacillus nasuensis]|uniref:Ribonuclease R n=1 Tax=Lacticaseibacillus nasuensis JCM 17158 TaxID=1291734 RepID=A0A0R1JTJ5_9LACO|nr:ribonuclease R [Lacticaseibacillus nasuensis]KRK72547.1 exoribonuclease R [Lacticaseibacillus nasuensis JCM 17158]
MTTVGHLRNELLATFRRNPKINYSVQSLQRALKLTAAADFKVLVQALAGLEHDNLIHQGDNDLYVLGGKPQAMTGTFRGNEKGFGFVSVEGEDNDAFIAPPNTDFALDGDTVELTILRPGSGDRGPEGAVTAITERHLTKLVGEFTPLSDGERDRTGFIGVVTSHEKKLKGYPVFVKDTGSMPELGDMLTVMITEYPDAKHPKAMRGIISENLGNKNTPGVDVLSLVYANDIHVEYPEDAMAQANAIPDHVTDADRVGRRDITDQPVVTIDGDDSKDFDDAVVAWQLPNGNYHLGVHIADVSYYVTEGSPLDKETYDRGTSTYLVDRVIPMLPFRLSNGICSLNPDVDRLAMSCDMEIDPQGHVVKHEIYQSIIRSHGRLTYNKVNAVLTDHDPAAIAEYGDLVPMLELMGQLHEILYKMRHARGAIDFEENEAKIIVDDQGHPTDIVLRDRGLSERMIESFMLQANETVAEHYNKLHLPFLYRVHETPDADRIKEFIDFLATFGIHVPIHKGTVTPKMLQDVNTQVAGTPEEMMVNVKMLRSLKQAHYSEDPLGHFGIAAQYYTHFTSPIRRYPDLIVHRLIRDYATKGTGDDLQASWREKLPDIAVQTSTRERHSVDAERAVDDLKKAEFMADKVGEEFDAVVSGVAGFGMFVALPNTVEGLVHITRMTDDYYQFVESQMALIGERTHHMFRIGQPVRVKLENVDIEQRQVDFSLIPSADTPVSDIQVTAPKRAPRRDDHARGNGGKTSGKPSGNRGNRGGRPERQPREDKKDPKRGGNAKHAFTIGTRVKQPGQRKGR